MPRVRAGADPGENRLYITIGGKPTKRDLDTLYTDVGFCVADLQPGFTVITDLSQCTIAALSVIPTFKKITRHLVANRVGLVVRIQNEDNLVVRQLFNFTARMGGYKAIHVTGMEEAKKELQRENRENELSFLLHNRLISFQYNEEKGSGIITAMSTNGCSATSPTLFPCLDESIDITITFKPPGELTQEFSNNSTVLTTDEDGFIHQLFTPGAKAKKIL